MDYERFIFYGSFRKTIEVLEEELGNKVLRAIMNYGTTYELPKINPDDADSTIVFAIMQSIIPVIEKQKTNYESFSKGGRPVSYTQADFDVLFDEGLTNKEVEEQIGCSASTVERRKKIWKDKEIDTDNDMEKNKDKDMDMDIDSDGYDGYDGSHNTTQNANSSSNILNNNDIEQSTISEIEETKETEMESPNGDSTIAQKGKWESALVPYDKRTSEQKFYIKLLNEIKVKYRNDSIDEVYDKIDEAMLQGYSLIYINWAVAKIKKTYREGKLKDNKWIILELLPSVLRFKNYIDEWVDLGREVKNPEPINLFKLLTTFDEVQFRKEQKEKEEKEKRQQEKDKKTREHNVKIFQEFHHKNWQNIGK